MGSDDACVDIYDISTLEKGPNRVGSCKGIPSYVTHIDWSTDSKYLQVSTIMVWNQPCSHTGQCLINLKLII